MASKNITVSKWVDGFLGLSLTYYKNIKDKKKLCFVMYTLNAVLECVKYELIVQLDPIKWKLRSTVWSLFDWRVSNGCTFREIKDNKQIFSMLNFIFILAFYILTNDILGNYYC